MKKLMIASIIAVMGLGGYAFADGYGGKHMRGGMCNDDVKEHAEKMLRLAERAIQPTKAQMPAWEKVKESVTDISEQMHENCETRKENREKNRGKGYGNGDGVKSPLDRLAKMESKTEMKLEMIRSLQESITPFYESLSDEQKQAVSDLMPGKHGKKRWMK